MTIGAPAFIAPAAVTCERLRTSGREVPGLTSSVLVNIATKTGLENTQKSLRVVGTFRVQEISEQGYMLAIYSIDDAEASVIP